MYQGKFDKKRKASTTSTSELVAARNSANAQDAAKRAQTAPAERAARNQTVPARQSAPAKQAAPARQSAPARQPAPKTQAPARKQPPRQEAVQVETRRGPRLGGVIFYTLYFMFIFLFFAATYLGLQWFHGWLSDYEMAQPTVKSAEVFHQLFDDPDWGALYDAAGVADTQYETRDDFVTYMENRVGDSELTYQETAAGLGDAVKYFVKLGNEKLASFTLVKKGSTGTSAEIPYLGLSVEIPNWQMGNVELFFERGEGFRIQKQDGHTAYVNGIALSDDHTIQYSTIKGEGGDFLPAGATIPRTCIQEIGGLIIRPTVVIKDEKGNEVDVVYDESQGMFIEQTEATTISAEEEKVALEAIKVYAEYQIKEASSKKVANYFDSNGSAYKSIMQTVLTWTKGNNGYSFANDSVTNYNRYSDTQFSVYASTDLTIKLTDGGTTEKPIHATLLFTKKNGSWKVTQMTNEDIGTPVGKVRLTFKNGDTVLSSEFYETDQTDLETPLISAPEGKVLAGWYRETVDANGNKSLMLVFEASENGKVSLPRGTVLEPMTLYPWFENA